MSLGQTHLGYNPQDLGTASGEPFATCTVVTGSASLASSKPWNAR